MRGKFFKRDGQGLQSIDLNFKLGRNQQAIFETVQIRKQWPSIVGEFLAQKTFVKKVVSGVVWVSVDHGGWAHQLNMIKADLVKKIQAKTSKKITEIKWVYEGVQSHIQTFEKIQPVQRFKKTKADPSQSLDQILSRVRTLAGQMKE